MPWDIQKNNYPSKCNHSLFIHFFQFDFGYTTYLRIYLLLFGNLYFQGWGERTLEASIWSQRTRTLRKSKRRRSRERTSPISTAPPMLPNLNSPAPSIHPQQSQLPAPAAKSLQQPLKAISFCPHQAVDRRHSKGEGKTWEGIPRKPGLGSSSSVRPLVGRRHG